MTTTAQQTVVTVQELACLRAFAEACQNPALHRTSDGRTPGDPMLATLAAKGLIDASEPGHLVLTPAGEHALHVGDPGCATGLDT